MFCRLKSGSRKSHAPDSDAADVFKQNNPWKRADFGVKAPGMDWDAYFKSAGLAGQSEFIVWQPSAVTGASALVRSESIDIWKDYLRFHLVEHYASVLPKAVAAEDFAFYGTILSGAQQAPDRSTSAIAATNAALAQAVGQLYTQRYFPPEAKAKAQAMAARPDHRLSRPHSKSHLDVTADKAKSVGQAGGASKSASAIPTHGSTIRRSTSCAATPSETCAVRKPSIVCAISRKLKTTGRSHRVADRSADSGRGHHVQPQR